jgi:hypothetical protein
MGDLPDGAAAKHAHAEEAGFLLHSDQYMAGGHAGPSLEGLRGKPTTLRSCIHVLRIRERFECSRYASGMTGPRPGMDWRLCGGNGTTASSGPAQLADPTASPNNLGARFEPLQPFLSIGSVRVRDVGHEQVLLVLQAHKRQMRHGVPALPSAATI